jgi:hypothetical protein
VAGTTEGKVKTSKIYGFTFLKTFLLLQGTELQSDLDRNFESRLIIGVLQLAVRGGPQTTSLNPMASREVTAKLGRST